MMDETRHAPGQAPEQSPPPSPPKKEHVLAPGETVFTAVLLLVGLIAFALALQLWMRVDPPRISSAAALPLFVSGLWVVLAFLAVLENRRLTSPLSALKLSADKIWQGLRYAMPRDVTVILGAILGYCVALVLGLSFYLSTPLFLYGTMCYLTRKHYIRNILWTALVMAFIVVVFRMLFGVVFP